MGDNHVYAFAIPENDGAISGKKILMYILFILIESLNMIEKSQRRFL